MTRTPEQELRIRTRCGFLGLAAAGVAGLAGWTYLLGRAVRDGVSSPFRSALELNESVAGNVLFDSGHRAPEFDRSRAEEIRENGEEGLEDEFDPADWKLGVTARDGTARDFGLDAIRRLPRVEQTTEFKCIEGWSTVVHWAGARFSDFTAAYAPGSEKAAYAGLMTPDKGYFVGIDRASVLHPQTLLAYEMNGSPLTDEHGAPLRLVIPVKYGIKNIKRIGSIAYVDRQPQDYWADRGYDYYAGL